MRWTLGLTALPLAAALLAGCVEPDYMVPADADPTADIRPDGGGGRAEPFILRVLVLHETMNSGDRVGRAAVVVTATSQPSVVEFARTGPDGTAELRFFVDGTANLAVGGVPGLTVEETFDIPLGPPGDEGNLIVVLYDVAKPLLVEGTFAPSLNDPAGLPLRPVHSDLAVSFGEQADAGRGYLQRLAGLDLELRWDNGAADFADLFPAVQSGTGVRFEGTDDRQLPADLDNVERLVVSDSDARALGTATAEDPLGSLVLRAGSRWPSGPLPVQFSWSGTASFKGSDLVIR